MNASIVTPMISPPTPDSGLVLLDSEHQGCDAVRGLIEGTQSYENRILWKGGRAIRPRIYNADPHWILQFPDKTLLGAQALGTDLIVYPAPLAMNNAALPLQNIAPIIIPYLQPSQWRQAVHHPTDHAASIRALERGSAFLPYWGQTHLFPTHLKHQLEALLWAIGDTFKQETNVTSPFSLTLMGTIAGKQGLEGPTLLISSPATQATKQWKEWMGKILNIWIEDALGESWRLWCIKQHPKGQQGLLAQINIPGPRQSAHHIMETKAFVLKTLADLRA